MGNYTAYCYKISGACGCVGCAFSREDSHGARLLSISFIESFETHIFSANYS